MSYIFLCLTCKLKPFFGAYIFFSFIAFHVILIRKLKNKFNFKYLVIPQLKKKPKLEEGENV